MADTATQETEDNSVGIESLPDETLLVIFEYLDLNDVAKLAPVCKRFDFLTSDELLWKIFFYKRKYTLPGASTNNPRVYASNRYQRFSYQATRELIPNPRYKGKSYHTLLKEKHEALQQWKRTENTSFFAVGSFRYGNLGSSFVYRSCFEADCKQ